MKRKWFTMTADQLHEELNNIDKRLASLAKCMEDFERGSQRWNILQLSIDQNRIVRTELIIFFVVYIGYNPDNLCTTAK